MYESSINRHEDGEGITTSVRLAVEDKQDYHKRITGHGEFPRKCDRWSLATEWRVTTLKPSKEHGRVD